MAKKKLKKSEKRLLIALGVVAVIGGGVLYSIYGVTPEPEIISQSDPTAEIQEAASSSSGSRSGSRGGGSRGGSRGGGGGVNSPQADIDNLQNHNQPNDCWVTIDGQIYDITGFIQEYQSIDNTVEGYCGTYGFEAGFLAEHPELRDFVLRNSVQK
ncbi:MAG: cytochrome b5 domain-containing protein [Candidatus Pacebacteria bacterium]|nr:cytochrome b5 domain-containing protein [Candidatus Paceibacterota bacterium]